MTLSSGLSLLGSTWQFIRGVRSRAGHRVPVIRVKGEGRAKENDLPASACLPTVLALPDIGARAIFTMAAPLAKDGPTDIFFARMEPGR